MTGRFFQIVGNAGCALEEKNTNLCDKRNDCLCVKYKKFIKNDIF